MCVCARVCVCFVQSQWLGGQWQARGKRIMSQLHTTSLLIINNPHSLLVTVSLWNTPSVAKRRCCDTQDNCISNPRPPKKKKKVVDDFIGRLCWHFFRRYRWMTAARYTAECLPLKAKYLFCFNLFAVWWVDMWQFRAFEKSTYFLYSWQFSIFFPTPPPHLLASDSSLCGKKKNIHLVLGAD